MSRLPTFTESVSVPSGQISLPSPGTGIEQGIVAGAQAFAGALSEIDKVQRQSRARTELLRIKAMATEAAELGQIEAAKADTDQMGGVLAAHMKPVQDAISNIQDENLRLSAMEAVQPIMLRAASKVRGLGIAKTGANELAAIKDAINTKIAVAGSRYMTPGELDDAVLDAESIHVDGVGTAYFDQGSASAAARDSAKGIVDAQLRHLIDTEQFDDAVDLLDSDKGMLLDPNHIGARRREIEVAKSRKLSTDLAAAVVNLDKYISSELESSSRSLPYDLRARADMLGEEYGVDADQVMAKLLLPHARSAISENDFSLADTIVSTIPSSITGDLREQKSDITRVISAFQNRELTLNERARLGLHEMSENGPASGPRDDTTTNRMYELLAGTRGKASAAIAMMSRTQADRDIPFPTNMVTDIRASFSEGGDFDFGITALRYMSTFDYDRAATLARSIGLSAEASLGGTGDIEFDRRILGDAESKMSLTNAAIALYGGKTRTDDIVEGMDVTSAISKVLPISRVSPDMRSEFHSRFLFEAARLGSEIDPTDSSTYGLAADRAAKAIANQYYTSSVPGTFASRGVAVPAKLFPEVQAGHAGEDSIREYTDAINRVSFERRRQLSPFPSQQQIESLVDRPEVFKSNVMVEANPERAIRVDGKIYTPLITGGGAIDTIVSFSPLNPSQVEYIQSDDKRFSDFERSISAGVPFGNMRPDNYLRYNKQWELRGVRTPPFDIRGEIRNRAYVRFGRDAKEIMGNKELYDEFKQVVTEMTREFGWPEPHVQDEK